MTRIKTFHREGGVPYEGTATTYRFFDGSGIGFRFCPQEGPYIDCRIADDNKILNRDTGLVIGEYNPLLKLAVIVLEDEPDADSK